MANDKKPSNFKINPWWIYGTLIILFFGLNFLSGAAFQESAKISASKFNEYLEKGQVEKIIIYNKTEAEAFLTKDA